MVILLCYSDFVMGLDFLGVVWGEKEGIYGIFFE